MKPLVCVLAHPDDEAFGPAGTIAKFAKERDVYIICVTSGDGGGHAQTREQELLASAKILGVKDVTFLRFEDGSLCNNLYHVIEEKVTAYIERYKPDEVLTFEPRGVSGHIDHVAVSLVTSFIFQKFPYIKKLWYFCEHLTLTEQVKNYFIYFPKGFERDQVDEVVDTSAFWETKVLAMHAHVSQKHDADWIIGLQEKLPKEEYFLTLTK